MNSHVARWLDALGTPGTIAIGLLAFCAAFYFGTVRPAEERFAALKVERARLERQHPAGAADGPAAQQTSTSERLSGFYELLAEDQSAAKLLETIDGVARRNGFVLRQGSYRFSWDARSRSGRYDVSYSGRATYHQARVFVHEVLYELPMVSLDEVSFQRQQTTDAMTEINARFSVFVKRES